MWNGERLPTVKNLHEENAKEIHAVITIWHKLVKIYNVLNVIV